MADRITAVKKSSLAGLAEGWGDECYAIVRQATYDDMTDFDELTTEGKTKREQVDYQQKVVADHFVAGKIKTYDIATGEQQLVDMTAADVTASVAICDQLMADIMGFDLDPKDLRRAAAQELRQSSTDDSTSQPSSAAPEISTTV